MPPETTPYPFEFREKMSRDDSLQASSPRSVTSPQLPSARTFLYELFIWYHGSHKETGTKYTGLPFQKIMAMLGVRHYGPPALGPLVGGFGKQKNPILCRENALVTLPACMDIVVIAGVFAVSCDTTGA
ncbi:hypothetical protein CA13_55240 [Planctomycetes bacterium CA13]|uniref:Uncharacterized protein n=1 Tax=Novipirellula herctigrandis TaxID=2527986 RepID=A0A5C5ZA17_9BACT|nr:hypothetical protein CA13_55240 [Planctomycetes bacterium CA13]